MDTITENLYQNYITAACKPRYLNVKLEDSSFQQYGETLKKFNRKIYQWLMNSILNVSNKNLHRSVFSTSDVQHSQNARKTAIIVKELSVGKHSENRTKNTVIKILFIGTTNFNKKLFEQMK